MLKSINSLALTLFVFGLFGWIYIALVALIHPQTLPIQLTHLAKWPREDTFGEVSFVTSLISFFIWRITGKEK